NSIAVDSKGHLHLAYANVGASTEGLRYAFWDGAAWHNELVDGLEQNHGEAVGYSVFILVDRDGNPHITYSNEANPQVRYAVKKEGRWHLQIIDRLAAVGYPDRNSMTLDEAGRPYIGYFDAGLGVLKIAHQEGDQWFSEVVDGSSSGFSS